MNVLCFSSRRAIFVLCLAMGLGAGLRMSELAAFAQAKTYIPATAAFDNSPVCSDSDIHRDTDLARGNPEWKPVNGLTVDPNHPAVNDEPVILEGEVIHPPSNQSPTDQSPAEVAEEDIPWNHYTHDFTFKVAPDLPYQYLLSSWVNGAALPIDQDHCSFIGGTFSSTRGCVVGGDTCPNGLMDEVCHHADMEVEWENASAMKINDDDDRTWGGLPEFAWPAVGDRVWVVGRWIFDCGHPGVPDAISNPTTPYVKFATEIHPPRAVAAIRVNHAGLSSLGSTFSESWLPVTGAPNINIFGKPSSDPTHVPVTEADVFVSGNGGGANDLCMLMGSTSDNDCRFGHTNPVLPVNDRYYVFDIYPPGTNYGQLHVSNGTFVVTPPVPFASLQWRVVDQSSQIPAHACGGTDTSSCVKLEDLGLKPIFCLVDEFTAPPDATTNQADTTCPTLSALPSRLRVILPFKGTTANVFAQSIVLGWDDVPAPPTTKAVRTFRITLHEYDVVHNDEFVVPGDWRVFVSVGGQWRYMSPLSDGYPDNNPCTGDQLTSSGDGDCFQFENTPWIVSVQDGTPIHVAVGGFDSDSVDSDFLGSQSNRGKYPNGDDPFGIIDSSDLVTGNDDRLGTYEFDLVSSNNYAAPAPYLVVKAPDFCIRLFFIATCDLLLYSVEFHVREIVSPPVDASFPLQIGDPHSSNFVTSHTPLILTAANRDYQGFQYRFRYREGFPLIPTYASSPFPVHWTSVNLPGTSQSVSVYDNFGNPADGSYDLQYSAETSAHQLEPRNTATVILDNTPPVATITQPAATQYVHSDSFTISYSVSDGAGSGRKSDTPNIDGLTTLQDGTPVANNQPVHLLTALTLGTHTFNVVSVDNVSNTGTNSVPFSVIVTAESIKADVTQFVAAGKITVDTGNSLLGILDAAAKARAAGDCNTANNLYRTFIKQVQTLSGKKIDPTAAQIMILDAQYLIAHCP